MSVGLVPVLLAVVVLATAAAGVIVLSRRQERRLDDATEQQQSLRYRVEPGEDPVSIVTTLHAAGFDAVSDGDVVILMGDIRPERGRSGVREVLRNAPVNTQGDPRPPGSVRFVDEQGGRGMHSA